MTTTPAAAWTGSAAMFAVTGLLGGFAPAVAEMLALVGTGERRRG